MTDRAPLLMFAIGCAVGALAVTFGATLAADENGAIHVCAANDGVMRLAQGSECPAGQTSLYLARPGTVSAERPPNDDLAAKQKIADLEKSVAELERMSDRGELGNRAEAPFEVKDRDGKVIFKVDTGYVKLYNRVGKAVAEILASDSGGGFQALSASADLQASMGVGEVHPASVMVTQGGTTRLSLGRAKQEDRYALIVSGSAGKMVAGMGQNLEDGNGVILVADQGGVYKAGLSVLQNNHGAVAVNNSAGQSVAYLTEGANGGGNLTLNGPTGEKMVEAGVASGGYGVVRAGPGSFKPGYGLLGLPGSFIVGKP